MLVVGSLYASAMPLDCGIDEGRFKEDVIEVKREERESSWEKRFEITARLWRAWDVDVVVSGGRDDCKAVSFCVVCVRKASTSGTVSVL